MDLGGSDASQQKVVSRSELGNNRHSSISVALWIIIKARKCCKYLSVAVVPLYRSKCSMLNFSEMGVYWYSADSGLDAM